MTACQPMGHTPDDARFGIAVDDDNGHHVRFRVFATTGGQHLAYCGLLVMTTDEFRSLLEPALTDRSDPSAATREA